MDYNDMVGGRGLYTDYNEVVGRGYTRTAMMWWEGAIHGLQ